MVNLTHGLFCPEIFDDAGLLPTHPTALSLFIQKKKKESVTMLDFPENPLSNSKLMSLRKPMVQRNGSKFRTRTSFFPEP